MIGLASEIGRRLAAVLRTAVELAFPQYCAVCDDRIIGAATPVVCPACWQRIERIEPPLCPRCGRPHDQAVGFATDENFPCAACRERPLRWLDMACSAVVYDDVLREVLLMFKFGRRDVLAPELAELMAEFARARLPVDQFDWAVPVPLHQVRQRQRGFNQALLLAQEFSRIMHGPPVVCALVKPEPTEPQTKLDAEQRRKNLCDAFQPAPGIELTGRRILVIDDVLTTGSTVDECARVLKRAGALEVAAFTLARRVTDLGTRP